MRFSFTNELSKCGSIPEMKSPIQWKRFLGLIRQSMTNTFCQQKCFSILNFLTIQIEKKKALIPFGTTQKFRNFDGIPFVSTRCATHFFAVRVFISTDGIFNFNGIFYFSEWLFYFDTFLKVFFRSNFDHGFFKKWVIFFVGIPMLSFQSWIYELVVTRCWPRLWYESSSWTLTLRLFWWLNRT